VKARRYWNIDFLRFVMAVMIVYYHVLHASVMPFTNGAPIYTAAATSCRKMSLVADLFFILSGVFLWPTLKSCSQVLAPRFIYGKISRLWPVLASSLLGVYLLSKQNGYVVFLDAIFLQCIGVVMEYRGILWYVSSMFWAMIFYFLLAKALHNRNQLNLAIAVVAYFGYVANMQATTGGFTRDMAFGVVCLGLWSALSLMGVGIFCAEVIEHVENFRSRLVGRGKIKSVIQIVFWTLVEIVCIWSLWEVLVLGTGHKNCTVIVVAFCVFVMSCMLRLGLVARMLDYKVLGSLGCFSYSIYAMQPVAFKMMEKWIWPCETIIANFYVCIVVSCAAAITLGCFVYYCIEKPGKKILQHLPYFLLRGG